jgi:hypothetical protein
MDPTAYNSTQEYQWSGLKQQLTNLARYANPIVPMWIIICLTVIFIVYSGIATGWGTGVIFAYGKTGDAALWWKVAGYIFGFAVAAIIMLNVIYQFIDKIKLTGQDYGDTTVEKVGTTFNIYAARATTIIFCAMFTFAQVRSSDIFKENVEETKAAKIENLNQVKNENRNRYNQLFVHYTFLDKNNDSSDDIMARRKLDSLLVAREIEKAEEDSSLKAILAEEKKAPPVQQAGISDATEFFKVISDNDKVEKVKYYLLIALLSIILGIVADGGIMIGAKIISKKYAFDNITGVLSMVNQSMREITTGYNGKLPVKSSKNGKSRNGTVDRNSPEKEPGEGIDLESPKIKNILNDIENHWQENGGDLTFAQIGEMNEGVTKQYISQVFQKAAAKGKIIDPREL